MTTSSQITASGSAAAPKRNLFGIPLDQLGWFACLLLSVAAGLLAFCLACFAAIFGVLFYNSFGHHAVDFAVTYKFIALPAGLVVLALSLVYLGSLWMRRVFGAKPTRNQT
ncbi:MAG: hypothetical protein ACYCSN_09085 [Acidobacteriaceae bacterium]